MSIRLSSFLTDIERGLKAGDPILKGGVWDTGRTLNYTVRLARLALGARQGKDQVEPLGAIMLQAFVLPDGSHCLKASLFWTGQEDAGCVTRSIFEKPSADWTLEASRIAETWLAGPPRRVAINETVERETAGQRTG